MSNDAAIKAISKETPVIRKRLKGLNKQVDTIISIGKRSKTIDERFLKKSADQAMREVIQMRHDLTSLADQIQSVASSGGVDKRDARGHDKDLKLIRKEFEHLGDASKELRSTMKREMGDPNRWEGGRPETGSVEKFEKRLGDLMKIWKKLRTGKKLSLAA